MLKTVFHSSSVSPAMGEKGISRALLNGNENENDRVNDGNEPVNDTINGTINTVSDTIKGLSVVQKRILETISREPEITRQEMMNLLNVSDRTISRALKHLQEQQVITREGSKKTGK